MLTSQLEQTTAIRILFYLKENKEAKMTELMKQLRSSQHPVYTALHILKELKLIEEEVTSYPLKRIFTLTGKGRLVAEKLKDIEGILES
jgi:predicted transcriptional regulator